VVDLAKKVAEKLDAEIRYYENPRVEDGKNGLRICNQKFLQLGLDPITLNDGLMTEVYEVARKYKDRCDLSRICCTSRWRDDIPLDLEGSPTP
jgi:UDP-sulfoquinovose synthase